MLGFSAAIAGNDKAPATVKKPRSVQKVFMLQILTSAIISPARLIEHQAVNPRERWGEYFLPIVSAPGNAEWSVADIQSNLQTYFEINEVSVHERLAI